MAAGSGLPVTREGLQLDALTTLDAARLCGYSQCGRPLPRHDGRGRPPEYCTDRHDWPGGKSCKQMAQAERDEIRVAGLDASLEMYDAVAGRLTSATKPVAAELTRLVTAWDEVRQGALARTGDAERRMAAALQRADAADRDAQVARREYAVTRAEAAAALEQARSVHAEAERIRADARAQLAGALDRLEAGERSRGQALAAAAAAETTREEAVRREQDAVQHATELDHRLQHALEELDRVRATHDQLRDQHDMARVAQAQADAARVEAQHQAHLADTRAAALAQRLDEQGQEHRTALAEARGQATAADREARELRAERDRLGGELATATANTTAVATLTDRLEKLLAADRDGRPA